MKTFKKRRNGRTLEFDAQIDLWRRHRKKKGALKDSYNKRVGAEKAALELRKAITNMADFVETTNQLAADTPEDMDKFLLAMFGK